MDDLRRDDDNIIVIKFSEVVKLVARSEKAIYVALVIVLDYFSYKSIISSQPEYFFAHQLLFLVIGIVGWHALFKKNRS